MLLRLLAITAAAFAVATGTAVAADPIMPLGEVHGGLRCTGLTVVRGVDIASFDVEVIDVVAGDAVAGDPLILVRASGGAAEPAGIASGFSGAPVICGGRIAGAIAFGTGDYGNKVALATPIESLLGTPVPDPPAARHALPRALRGTVRPLATPIAVRGVDAAVLAPFARRAAKAGLVLQAVPTGPVGSDFPVQPLVPGASMAVGLASGDLAAGAVGTVTYVDGPRVWALGHPFDATGRRSLLLQDAWVYTVIDNPIGIEGATSTKLAAPGHDLGSITFDGRFGVTGLIGAPPPQTAVHVLARNEAGGAARESNVQVADETEVGLPSGASPLALVAPLAVAQAGFAALDGSPVRQSAEMCVRFRLRELSQPTGFCNRYVGDLGGGASPGGPYAIDLADAIAAIDAFTAQAPHVVSVDADLKVAAGLEQAFIVGVRGPRVVRPGRSARLTLQLQRYRGARFERQVTLRVPRSTERGRYDLGVSGTPADGAIEDAAVLTVAADDTPRPSPATFAGLARQISRIGRWDGVYSGLRPAGSEQPVPGRRLFRDADVRISGSASYPVRVRAAAGGKGGARRALASRR
ncbi:hypothetical protein [Capillimicrobium parvum]|uniref:hypothetical protein n=1 Tax=Capillimicrobium parvum TaxID=2884022 RepID=UPI00216B61AC|nr:hypothetical protein [Capillimicrobium parvum]